MKYLVLKCDHWGQFIRIIILVTASAEKNISIMLDKVKVAKRDGAHGFIA